MPHPKDFYLKNQMKVAFIFISLCHFISFLFLSLFLYLNLLVVNIASYVVKNAYGKDYVPI